MSAHITVLPASTQAGRETIRNLLQYENKSFVRGIYRDPSKAPTEFTEHPRFEAVKGDVGTESKLDFKDSNAVMYIPPPVFDGRDQGEFATQAAQKVADALKRSPSVKRLVLHSALGAQHDHGMGVIRLNHISDDMLKETTPEVVIVRPCNYYENWAYALESMQADPPQFESPYSPADWQIPMVSVKDVGEYCAQILLQGTANSGFRCVKLFGPRLYSFLDVKDAVENIVGRKGQLITIQREELAEFWAKQVPKAYVQDFVDFTTAQLAGGVAVEDYEYGDDTIRCQTELIDGLRKLDMGQRT